MFSVKGNDSLLKIFRTNYMNKIFLWLYQANDGMNRVGVVLYQLWHLMKGEFIIKRSNSW